MGNQVCANPNTEADQKATSGAGVLAGLEAVPIYNEPTRFKPIGPGDPIPSIDMDLAFPPDEKVNIAERAKDKKIIIVGLPGAFTPT